MAIPATAARQRVLHQAVIWLGLLAVSVTVQGCRSGGQRGADAGRSVGVTLLTREHEFYRQLEEGLREAAARHALRLIVASGDFDLAKQQSQIDNFLVQRVDAIVVCPVDSKGIAPAIEKANMAGVPVFTADIAADGGDVVSHVASDNLAGGRLAAAWLAGAIGERGEVGIIGQPDLQSTIDREQGFAEELRRYPGVRLVASINGGGVRDRALKAADDMLQAHPNIRGIFAINDESALAVLSSAESRRNDAVVIVGYDATPEATRAIAAGTVLRADVAQQPRVIGARTIEAIASLFQGKRPEPRITVPVRIVDRDSVAAQPPSP